MEPAGVVSAPAVGGPWGEAAEHSECPPGPPQRRRTRRGPVGKQDFLDDRAAPHEQFVDRSVLTGAQAEQRNVMALGNSREELRSCPTTVPRVEPRRKRRAHQQPEPPRRRARLFDFGLCGSPSLGTRRDRTLLLAVAASVVGGTIERGAIQDPHGFQALSRHQTQSFLPSGIVNDFTGAKPSERAAASAFQRVISAYGGGSKLMNAFRRFAGAAADTKQRCRRPGTSAGSRPAEIGGTRAVPR